jgi:hypothetical protein
LLACKVGGVNDQCVCVFRVGAMKYSEGITSGRNEYYEVNNRRRCCYQNPNANSRRAFLIDITTLNELVAVNFDRGVQSAR